MRRHLMKASGLPLLLTAILLLSPHPVAARGPAPLVTVPFGADSALIGADGVGLLDAALAGFPEGDMKVVGYSCYKGDPTRSDKLAAARAKAVADWLAGAGRAPVEVTSSSAPCGTPKGRMGRVAVVFPLLPDDNREGADDLPAPPQPKLINIDFKDAEIQTVIRTFAELTGKNCVIDEKVKGKVTIISPKEVTEAEAVRVFESTLEVYGYSMVQAGNVIKVVPTLDARQKATFGSGDPGDTLVTRLIPLKSVKAMELANTLRPLIPATSYLAAYAPSNTLIVTDFAGNVAKLLKIIDQIDSPLHEQSVTVVQLRFAGAKELTDKLSRIFGAEGSSQNRPGQPPVPSPASPAEIAGQEAMGQPQIIADERINSLIIVAARPVTDRILELIAQLDVPSPRGRGRINVHYLKYGDAEEMAKVLNNIAGQATPAPGQPGLPNQATQLTDKVTITPDKSTNSLVITASVEDYETLKGVIDRLDIRRRQVFVEALIMEVSSSKSRQFGIEWRSTADFTQSGVKPYGGQDFGNINNTAVNPLAAPMGMAVGVVDGVIEYGGKQFLNIGALAHALQTDAEVNVLSTPNILTTDNEEAEIVVADEVPLE
ncbi:MAG: type II secretion system secretin GspD, partial [Nitrospinae bacterium]|nr:type II secretion system secretin GspD [Nitrospinota bacterium]